MQTSPTDLIRCTRTTIHSLYACTSLCLPYPQSKKEKDQGETTVRILTLAVTILLSTNHAFAQSGCKATNTAGDQRCEITCQTGQRALCADATGNGKPICECQNDSRR